MRYIGGGAIPSAVDVTAFKRATHIADADVSDDSALEMLISAAQAVVMTATNIPPVLGEYEFTYRLWGWRRWWFPCRPVTAITGLAVNDADGAWIDQSLDGVRLVQGEDEPQLLLPDGWPGFSDDADTIRVRATCGGSIPDQIPRVIIALAKDWFESDISAGEAVESPRIFFGARRLIKQVRYRRPAVADQV